MSLVFAEVAAGQAPKVDLSRFIPPPRDALKVSDKVKIIKDRDSGIRYPPEWLEQYLGRTGRIHLDDRGRGDGQAGARRHLVPVQRVGAD